MTKNTSSKIKKIEICLKHTFLGLSKVLGLAISLDASRVTSRLEPRSNILKKLL